MNGFSVWSARFLMTIRFLLLFDARSLVADETHDLLKAFVAEFVAITPGEGKFPAAFEMGDSNGGPGEKPRHPVKMKNVFGMAKYEVTQNLYEAVMGGNPSKWKGPRNSVEMISWDDANKFCETITEKLQSQKLIERDEIIRLPTEAEWEYCCRAGTATKYSFGDKAQRESDESPKASILNEYAWHTGNAAGNDPPVGALKPNPWGLYDMHGYLWEFNADAWSSDDKQSPTDGSAVKPLAETTAFVIRGGSWKDDHRKLTSSARQKIARMEKDDAVGFRCVKSKQ